MAKKDVRCQIHTAITTLEHRNNAHHTHTHVHTYTRTHVHTEREVLLDSGILTSVTSRPWVMVRACAALPLPHLAAPVVACKHTRSKYQPTRGVHTPFTHGGRQLFRNNTDRVFARIGVLVGNVPLHGGGNTVGFYRWAVWVDAADSVLNFAKGVLDGGGGPCSRPCTRQRSRRPLGRGTLQDDRLRSRRGVRWSLCWSCRCCCWFPTGSCPTPPYCSTQIFRR